MVIAQATRIRMILWKTPLKVYSNLKVINICLTQREVALMFLYTNLSSSYLCLGKSYMCH